MIELDFVSQGRGADLSRAPGAAIAAVVVIAAIASAWSLVTHIDPTTASRFAQRPGLARNETGGV